ncbi:MAG: response regulator transcription factor [Lachnospiraceae bacterium]
MNNTYNIIVCDDEKDIVKIIKIYLAGENLHIFEAYNGVEVLEIMERETIHLVLMDIMMPVMDGLETLVKIRQRSNIPVILLTAKGEEQDRVLGLNVGADDYITKPFLPLELAARIKSNLRRYMMLGGSIKKGNCLSAGGIEMDDISKEVRVDGELISLTPTEYDILKLLLQHTGEVYSPEQIYRAVWKDAPYGAKNIVAVHMRHLREKLEANPSEPKYLKVVWGKGYKIEG